jgi:hypothetical protein
MPTKQITVYTYGSLPTEAAKTAARKWQAARNAEDPCGSEDFSRLYMAIRRLSVSELRELQADKDRCPITGFCGDINALEAFTDDTPDKDVHTKAVRAVADLWEQDVEFQQTDEFVTEQLLNGITEHWFLEDGRHINI